jgi:serine/threonine protein kinase
MSEELPMSSDSGLPGPHKGQPPPNSPESALPAGTKVRYFGDYELLEDIAHGGMGVVYKARQLSLNRPVALKMILSGLFASEQEVKRFRTEAEAAANLDHPNIVPIYEIGEHDGRHYFSMRFVEGGNLARHIGKFSNDLKAVARLLASVARAVHHAHQRGILHRDLKPSNILLDTEGQPQVTDFGLAKRMTQESNLTQSGSPMGTPSYMAPEQAQGKQIDRTADVYSLGAILYELLTRRAPFQADTPAAVYDQIIKQEPRPPSSLGVHVDRDLETICLKCLEKEQTRRYSTAQALAEDLERWLANEPIKARRAGLLDRVVKWRKREPALANVCIGLALVVAVGLGIAFCLWHPPRETVTFDFKTGKVIATQTDSWETNGCWISHIEDNSYHLYMFRGSRFRFTFQINHHAIWAILTMVHLSSAYHGEPGKTPVTVEVNGHPFAGTFDGLHLAFKPYTYAVPAAYLQRGTNVIEFHYADEGGTTGYWIQSLQLKVW